MNLPTIFFMTSKQTPFGMKAKKENLTTGFYKMQRNRSWPEKAMVLTHNPCTWE